LGCSKNQVDSEMMLADLKRVGYGVSSDVSGCSVVIINTCGFINDAKAEAIENILEMIELKKEGRIKKIIVTGCLSQRYMSDIEIELPEVDAFLGTGSYHDIAAAVDKVLNDEKYKGFDDVICHDTNGERVLSTPPYTAYLKIAEGCSNNCSYCTIPLIRGPFRSRELDSVLKEAQWLADSGVKEINIIAQDITRYGEDISKDGASMLPQLLTILCKTDRIEWIRPLYAYPERVTDELIDVMATESKIVKYIDIPVQHADDRVLKLMNRRSTAESLRNLFDKMRKRIPDLQLRTTVITGFPGEDEEAFENLCEFVKDLKFEKLGVFAYSKEEDTPAYDFDNQVDEEVASDRKEILMNIQSEISLNHTSRFIEKTVRVLAEGYDKYAESYFGRTMYDSPDIDGKVFFTSERAVSPGEFVDVYIDEVLDYDLIGRLTN